MGFSALHFNHHHNINVTGELGSKGESGEPGTDGSKGGPGLDATQEACSGEKVR